MFNLPTPVCETPVFFVQPMFFLGNLGNVDWNPNHGFPSVFWGEAKQQQLEGQDSQSPPINLGVFGRIRSEKRGERKTTCLSLGS